MVVYPKTMLLCVTDSLHKTKIKEFDELFTCHLSFGKDRKGIDSPQGRYN